MPQAVPITVAHGDGIGPEIMEATLAVLREAGAALEPEPIEIGERVYRRGISSGIEPSAWESLQRTRVFLKAPITTPQGSGFKSVNVTIRKSLGLFANVRPVRAYHPYVPTRHPDMNLVVIRENEEDLYAGIEHRQTHDVFQSLKLMSWPGSEKLIRYAFEFARRRGHRKVTCLSKDNIMKVTDGMFHRVFDEVGAEYPELEREHLIVDIGMARVAHRPERFDVVVTPNLYGDILSDVVAEISGSVGMGGSANLGDHGAMFEAVHGSAPDIAGKGIANPSGLLLAAVTMLAHIGQGDVGARVYNAWLRTLEDGLHTGEIFHEPLSRERVGTDGFARAVIERLGQAPQHLPGASDAEPAVPIPAIRPRVHEEKALVGVDVFLQWNGETDPLAAEMQAVAGPELALQVITNRGVKVWPEGLPTTFCTDHWRCRFTAGQGERATGEGVSHAALAALLQRLAERGLDFIKTENLYTFDGEPGFSLAQGQ